MGCGIYGIIYGIGIFRADPLYSAVGIFGTCVMMVLMFLMFIAYYRGRIIFGEEAVSIKDGLYMPGFFRRLQHAVTVNYKDIESISIMETMCDNLGKPFLFVFVNMKCIVFHLNNGQTNQVINIYHFSNRQKVKILNEIYTRMGVEYSKEEQPGKKLLEDFKVQQKKEWQAAKEQKKAERMAKSNAKQNKKPNGKSEANSKGRSGTAPLYFVCNRPRPLPVAGAVDVYAEVYDRMCLTCGFRCKHFMQRENRPRWYAGGFHSDITEDLSVVRTPKEGEQVFKQKGRAPFSASVRH